MKGYQKYQRITISTADPLRITIMLYEGAVKFLNQALPLMNANPEEAGKKIGRTQDILHYMRNTIDFEQGGEIAANLNRLFEYMQHLLTQANIHRDTEPVEESIQLLQTLLEGWHGLISAQTGDAESDAGAGINPTGISMVG